MLYLKSRLATTVASLLAIGLLAIAPITANANPTVFCTKTASGSVSIYTFPTDCSGSAFPTTYHTMYINILGQCSATYDTEEYIGMNFNGVSNTTSELYSLEGSLSRGQGTSGTLPAFVGYIPCRLNSTKWAGSDSIKVVRGLNGSDYSINWVATNTYMANNDAGTPVTQVHAFSGSWWNFSPDGPPLTSVTIRTVTNWTLGSQFTIYFE